MSLKGFLDGVLDKKREAEALGSRLELLVLPREFAEVLFKAVTREAYAGDAYSLGKEEDGFPVYLHGIKVLWSGGRLPPRQCWYRYSGGLVGERNKGLGGGAPPRTLYLAR